MICANFPARESPMNHAVELLGTERERKVIGYGP
jgi:hypothetical protein